MVISIQTKKELANWLKTYWDTYLRGDLETWATFIKDDYYNIGGTKEEIWHSKQEILDYTLAISDQLQGNAQFRNQTIEAEAYGEFVMVNEFTDMYVKSGEEWIFYGHFRMSSLMEKTETGWIVQHQHGSFPDMKASEGEAFGLDAVKAENERLKKSVEERTADLVVKNKELEIEAALERVRAQSIAMHNSSDVGKCIVTMYSELTALGVYEGTRFGIGILNHDNNNNQLWTARKDGEDVNMHIGHLDMTWHPLLKSACKAWKAQTPLHEYILEGEDLLDYYRMLNNAPDYKIQIAIEKLPQREIQYCFIFEHGFFYAFSPLEFQPELVAITQRFTAVFSQTYRRYLDLVNAESQAREAEIALALERVRARSLSMHQSDELKHVIEVVFDQMVALKIPVEHAGFIIDYKQNEDMHIWLADHQQGVPNEITIPYFDSPHWNSFREAKVSGDSFFANLLPFEVKNKFYQDLFQLIPSLTKEAQEVIFSKPALAISTVLLDHVGLYMENYADTPFSDEENGILMRFGKAFNQAYTRFLDLQKAESQAREAEIEAALERVRSRSLAMHQTSELQAVIHTVHQELKHLDVAIQGGSFITINADLNSELLCWGAGGTADTSAEVKVPDFGMSFCTNLLSGINKGPGFFTEEFSQKEKKEYFTRLFGIKPWSELGLAEKQATLSSEGGYARSVVVSKHTSIFIINQHGRTFTAAENDILKRFGKVFEQAYTRFLDLQKAEIQTRESQINLAVERVRAQSMAMHHPDDLDKVNKEILSQLNWLQVPGLTGVTFYLVDELGWVRAWDFSSPGNIGDQTSYTLQFDSNKHEMLGFPFKTLSQTDLDYFVADYPLEKLEKAVYEFEEIDPAMAKIVKEALSTGALTHQWTACARISNGLLGVDLVNPPNEDTKTIVLKMAGAFNQAYIRFLDLQKAEAQAREAKIEAALERIRSSAMAMHSSDGILSVTHVLREQIALLGEKELESILVHIYHESEDQFEAWYSYRHPELLDEQIVNGNQTLHWSQTARARKDKEKYYERADDYTIVADYQMLKEWYEYLFGLIPEVVELNSKGEILIPNILYYNYSKITGGALLLITNSEASEHSKYLLRRAASVFNLAYSRFLDLQKAEAQAREAEIELALERVRARTMAMKHSDELTEASEVLDQQVRALGIETWGCAFHIYADDQEGDYEWFTSREGSLPFYKTPREKFFLKFYEKGRAGETFHVEEFQGEDCKTHYDYLMTIPVMGDALRGVLAAGGSLPESQYDHIAFFKHGFLLFITYEQVPESHDIFKRFAKVFEQTYTRFLDLQKAEGQARKARIEAALEKIRARTMGMQHSNELPEAANLLFLEVQALGIPSWSAGYNILEDDKKSAMCWMSSEGVLQKPFQLRLWGEDSFDEMREFILSDQTMLVQELGGKAIEDHYRHMKSFPDLKPTFDEIDEKGLSLPTYQINHLCKFTQGFVLFITYEKVPEAHDIFQRFTKVFEQTFTRFVDLKKAEAQAREAKIEASLERLRAQSMAMHQSDDLILSTSILFEELEKLDLSIERSGIGIFDPETKDCDLWTCVISPKGKVELVRGVTSLTIHPMLVKTFDAWLEKKPFSYVLEGQELLDYYGIVSTSDFHLSKDAIETSTALPKEYYSYTPFGAGGLYFFAANEPKESDNEIVRRFAKVFDQTYTRFLDLQKAEAQIRNEKIKNALERVRSRSLAMHKSAELTEVIQTVSEQFKELEIDISGGAFIVINQDLEKGFYCWGAGGVGNYVRKVKIPFIERPIYQTLSNGIKNANPFFTEYYDVEEKRAFFKHLFKYHPFKDTPSSRQESLLAEESDYARSCVVSKNTSIFIINHDGKQFSEEENELLREMGRVFEQAYIRFIDLEKAEKQARLISEERDRLEITLDELKATQAQLIQQEKLASLGQLTAGIAHEIKNPLNFVNNFSDLSRELIDEVFEELANLEASATKEEIIAILQDVKSNLTKVHEHGSRADSIVTSMLQHSRASGSKREPKAFNPLVKEFVNLSFHGMRAGKAPINVDIDLQLDSAVGEVSLISEDFSRVILNLCNNAFDAMREKLKLEVGSGKPEAYLAKLTVKTALQKDKVILSIEDNGGGIPKEIQDKILQPFFTTKKGTEGTGLGLSITNDIIKAHGGELRVASEVDTGTSFIIELTV